MQSDCRSSRVARVHSGFSVAETLIVLSIAGLLAAIAAPSFSHLIEMHRIVVSSNALMGAFAMARQSAIAKNQVVTICAGSVESGCHADWNRAEWLIFTDRNRNGKRDSEDFLIQDGTASTGATVRILANRPLKMPVLFHPIGHAEQPSGAFAAGTIRICATSSSATPGVDLVLSKSGQIRTQAHDAGGNCTQP